MSEFDECERRQIWIERLKKELKDYEYHHDTHRLISSISQMLTLRDKKIYELTSVIHDLVSK